MAENPIIFVLVLSPEGAVLVLVLEKVKIFDNVKLDVYRVSLTLLPPMQVHECIEYEYEYAYE
jgi:hypothetical protein